MHASLTSAWVALVYDPIAKYRELSALGDAAATAFIQSRDAATAANDTRRLLRLEAPSRRQAPLRSPGLLGRGELFEPSPELVRLHLVTQCCSL